MVKKSFFQRNGGENRKRTCLNSEILVFQCGNQTKNVKEISKLSLFGWWMVLIIPKRNELIFHNLPSHEVIRLLSSFWRVKEKFPTIFHPRILHPQPTKPLCSPFIIIYLQKFSQQKNSLCIVFVPKKTFKKNFGNPTMKEKHRSFQHHLIFLAAHRRWNCSLTTCYDYHLGKWWLCNSHQKE